MNKLFKRLFIFEMANNHQGSVDHGVNLIRELGKIARKHNINAGVKLQYRNLDTFIHPDHLLSTQNKHIPRFLSTKLSANDFLTLVEEIKSEGMTTICTPFDETSVGLIQDHGIQIVKVASCSANDWPLLEAMAKTNKPVITSTGGLTLYQIDNLVSFLNHRNVDFALLHCIGIYPAPNNKIHMNFMAKLNNRFFDRPVGYSGHEDPENLDVVKVAVAKGAQILERHVGLPTETIKLNGYSLNPNQVDKYVEAALNAYEICGDIDNKVISQDELDSLNSLKRGVFARSAIACGETLDNNKVFFAFPANGSQTTTFEYHESMVASKAYEKNQPIVEKRVIRSRIDMIRSIVHEVKGMLNEAKIVIGNTVKIELSHQYGLEHFRQTGAVLIDVVNRRYCKKLIIVLHGQNHPTHYHRIKEETFQLLSGDLKVVTGETTKTLNPGDICLVEPSTPHSFSSMTGAIFEEVSTTHIIGDSIYEDESINKQDPMERKTIIENW